MAPVAIRSPLPLQLDLKKGHTMAKTRLAVLYGGITVEHEVSVITAVQLMKRADASKYDITPVYVDKSGKWWTGSQLFDIAYYGPQDLFAPKGLSSWQLRLEPGSNDIDVAILCFHGAYGEAGNVQGALELAGIPYQGPGVVGAAAAFDKIITRQVLQAEGVNQAKFTWCTATEWQKDPAAVQQRVDALTYPIFVKPANGGSTIGIEKVKSATELPAAVTRVLAFDERLVFEAEIKDCLEINVSVLGLEGDAHASVPEQPIKADEFLSYADKYERGGGKKGGMASASRRIPAPISQSLTSKVQAAALRAFHIFDCHGVIRIDFFVNPSTEEIFLVELNTIPGSMSYYLWEATKLPYAQMIDLLVEIAQTKHARRQKITTSFASNILKDKKEI